MTFPGTALGISTLAVLGVAAWTGSMPQWVAGWYFVASLVSCVGYFLDKSSARRGARRTPENTLHLVDLLGGWPGALVAQQQFRHKTAKQRFQSVFRVTVMANLAMLAWWMATAR